jgi:hypothetical protein
MRVIKISLPAKNSMALHIFFHHFAGNAGIVFSPLEGRFTIYSKKSAQK